MTITANGKKEITQVKINPEVVDSNDVEMLEDLILIATNEAIRQMEEISQNEMAKLSGSLGLPPGIL